MMCIYNFFLVLPYSYHCGFNLGYNIAEAVNYATVDWIPFGEKSINCDCERKKTMFTLSMEPFIFHQKKIDTLSHEYDKKMEMLKEERILITNRKLEEKSHLKVSINVSFTSKFKIQD